MTPYVYVFSETKCAKTECLSYRWQSPPIGDNVSYVFSYPPFSEKQMLLRPQRARLTCFYVVRTPIGDTVFVRAFWDQVPPNRVSFLQMTIATDSRNVCSRVFSIRPAQENTCFSRPQMARLTCVHLVRGPIEDTICLRVLWNHVSQKTNGFPTDDNRQR